MSNLDPADPVVRELRFTQPTPRDGKRVSMAGRLFEAFSGEWWEHTTADWRPPTKRERLFRRYAEMQRERTTDFRGVLPQECAVEVSDGRGGTRIDYRNVPIKNADGTLNKAGKALIEAHETQNRKEVELAQEINATPDGG